jgi:energy-coupling factor transporter transmembrane protein EcfT
MDEERQKKMRLMKIGVILAMILILVFWFFNFRNVWNLDLNNSRSVADNQNDWQQVRNSFSQSINDLQNRLNQIGAVQKKAENEANRAFIADLIKNTAALAASTASSTITATSTNLASSTLNVTASTSSSSAATIKIVKPKTKK